MGKQSKPGQARHRLKVVVYTITKNEEGFIGRYCKAARDADEVVIVDTGSTDRTVEVAEGCGATVHQISVAPWRFDVARNASLALLPADADVCVAADADEVMEPGWRQELERVWTEGTTRLRYLYDWGKGHRFVTDKIHARKGYFWKHPCHETLFADNRIKEQFAETPKLLIRHLPDDSKSRGSYFELLELAVSEDPHCVRHAFYFARELTFYGEHARAIVELQRYLDLPDSTWKDERGFAMRLLGDSLEALGRFDEALSWYKKATLEAPHRRESWFALAAACYRCSTRPGFGSNAHEVWLECAKAAHKALDTTGYRNDWPVDPEAWGASPHDYLALASFHLGEKKTALAHGRVAASLAEGAEKERLKANMAWYEKMQESKE